MNDTQLKELINKPIDLTIRVGDRVRVIHGPSESDDVVDAVWYTPDMESLQGKTYTVERVWKDDRRIALVGVHWTWIPQWLEKVSGLHE